MDKLEQLLSNPDSHGQSPSHEQVRAWSSAALERWATENQDVQTVGHKTSRSAERLKEAVYWIGAAACLAYLASLLYTYVSSASAEFSSVDLNLPTANDVSLMLRTHSIAISVVICGIAFAVTRPVREFLLRQLG
jgi:hypothetical protein